MKEDSFDEWLVAGKRLLHQLNDESITPSAYDTAWLASIPDVEGKEGPLFPQCLQWIQAQQLPDGSWGFADDVHYHDRILSTLSCVVTLATWQKAAQSAVANAAEQVEGGVAYITEHLPKLADDGEGTFAFALLFDALVERVRGLGIKFPFGSPLVQMLCTRGTRQREMLVDALYEQPTPWLAVVEGFGNDIDYERLALWQGVRGSLYGSPAATAVFYLQTGNERALAYLSDVVDRFEGAVPAHYPQEIGVRTRVLYDIHALGLQHYFGEEIAPHLDVIEAAWSNERGLSVSAEVPLADLETTAMAFYLLRLNGRNAGAKAAGLVISAAVLGQFYDGRRFTMYSQGDEGLTVGALLTLFEVAQVSYLDETILEQAEVFAKTALLDGDMVLFERSGRSLPEVANLLVQRRFFLPPFVERQKRIGYYAHQVAHNCVGKVVYKETAVHHPSFLALARAEGRIISDLFKSELDGLMAWGQDYLADVHTIRIPSSYFLGYNSVWEPTAKKHRDYFTYVAMWLFGIDGPYDDPSITLPEIEATTAILKGADPATIDALTSEQKSLVHKLFKITDELLAEVTTGEGDPLWHHYISLINRTIDSHATEASTKYETFDPTYDEYLEYGRLSIGIGSTLQATYCGMDGVTPAMLENPRYDYLLDAPSDIGRILNDIRSYKKEVAEGKLNLVGIVMKEKGVDQQTAADYLYADYETRMKELYAFALEPNTGIPTSYKMAAFDLCRTLAWFYLEFDFNKYSPAIFNSHHIA